MLKLVIADDEDMVRETMGRIIPWEELDIELVASCKNGIEAYDAILDENPDIAMTDIKMPGLSGIQLIERIRQVNDSIEFIILSGYGEFSLAAEAMKYGVKHYLLKPCDEEQIIRVMRSVSEDCIKKQAFYDYQKSIRKNASPQYKDYVAKTLEYIEENLNEPDLSLKKIAETRLFMNVDYLSKQFLKQTGQKFSSYVNEKRIQKAKLLLHERGVDKIYSIAEQVGCGNNPQYFSQLFKKYTGMTPKEYADVLPPP